MLRATGQRVEVLAAGSGKLRATRQLVEVLATGTGKVRVSAQLVEILACVEPPTVEVDATSSLSLTHAASGAFIIDVVAGHTLVLSHEALVECTKLVSHTIGLTQEAVETTVFARSVLDTISPTQEATKIVDYERPVVHNLTLSEEATVAYTKYVMGISLLEIGDVAVAEVIKPVQHTLLLTHQATLDLIRLCSDTLTPTHAASVEVVYARVASHVLSVDQQATRLVDFAREAEHTLSLGQNVVADHCRTVTTTIGLSDEADAELIRLAHDDLTITHSAGSNWVFIRRRTDNLALTHTAIKAAVRPREITSSLTLSQVAVATASKSIVDTLALTHAALVDNIRRASSTLTLSHVASVVNTRLSAHDDLLTLSHEATVGFVKQVSAANTLYLTQSGGSGLKFGTAISVLQETSYVADLDTGEEIPSYIGLQDVATAAVIRNTPYTVSDIISFAEHAVGIVVHADAIAVDATDALSLTHAAYKNETPTVTHTLTMTDLAAVVAMKAVSDTLVLTDAAVLNVFRATMAVTDTLTLGQSVTAVVLATNFLYQYHPIIGEGATGNPTPPSVELSGPMFGITAPFQLVYPAEGTVTDSVTLRAPELGNKDRLGFNRVIRETRGGTLVVFADPIWPKIQTLALSFAGLRRSEAQDLLDFFDDYLGLEIGMIDWEQRYWVGIITTPEEPIIEDGFNSYSVKFEFEGELDPTWTP